MQINNLQPYRWNYSELEPYISDKVSIKNKNYKINNGPFYRIENIKQIKYIDNQKLSDKYVYKLRDEDNNNEDIYIKLTFIQMLFFLFFHKIFIWHFKCY